MGFLDPGMITLALAYEAFVYIAAQIVNTSRIRWEDAQHAGDAFRAGTAVRDYHDSFGAFLLINGWIVFFFLTGSIVVALSAIFCWSNELLPEKRLAAGVLSTVMLALSSFTQKSMLASYANEVEQMNVRSPFRRTWPRLTRQGDV